MDENDITKMPEDIVIPETPVMTKPETWAGTTAKITQMQTGKLSDDVVAEINRRAKESAALQGYGVGTMAAKRTLRDIGVSSLSQIQKGTELGLQAGQVEGAWNLGQAELEQKRQLAQLEAQQQQRQINLQYMTAKMENALGQGKLAASVAEILAQNKERRLNAEIELTKMNAVYGTDIQKYLTQIGGEGTTPGYFEQADTILQQLNKQFNTGA